MATQDAVRRTADMIREGLDEAALVDVGTPVDVDGVRRMIEGYMAGIKDRGPLLLTDDVGLKVEAGDDPGAMLVTLYGKTDWGNAYLAEMLIHRGRDILPFSVSTEIPADMDPRLVAAMPELHAYYADNMAWGSLHIVLDDGNVEDHHVDYCLSYAKEHGDAAGASIARLLQAVTPEQRLKLHRWWYGIDARGEVADD